MKITILVASVSQTAETIAEAIAFEFSQQHAINVQLMDKQTTVELLQPDQLFIICASTYNIGDIPENANTFYQSFDQTPRDLSQINYGLIALGDRTYTATYAGGGKKLDQLMQDFGANRIGEPCFLDASGDDDQEEVAIEWFTQWLPQALAKIS